jgi:polyisoprenoid-binding protein YceI
MKTITARFTSFTHGQRFNVLLAAFTAGFLTGCSDPADNVPKSSASTAQQTNQPSATGKDYVIRAESKIGFVGSKVTGSHDGGFKKFAGKVTGADGKVTGTEIKIDMNSTWSDNERLTGHLKNADFFDVAKYPFSTFILTGITGTNVTGNLDLHGVTKSISFPADIKIADDAVTVKAEFAINRKDFNINYPGKTDDLIRDNVVLKLDLKATPGEPRPEDQLTN